MIGAQFLAFRRGIIYETNNHQAWAITPPPMVTPAMCDFISIDGGKTLVFREDLFDPLTRIRRGRFYTCIDGQSFRRFGAANVSNGLYGPLVGVCTTSSFDEDCWCEIVRSETHNISNKIVRIGGEPYHQPWKVIGVEMNHFGHQVFTLKAQSFYGAIPELTNNIVDQNRNTVDPAQVHQAQNSLNSLVDTIHRQQAKSIVDSARETAKVILTAWIGREAQGMDLAKVIYKIPSDKSMATWAAQIVNRLHPRGKSSEMESQASKGVELRTLVDEDAETSVQLIGLLLRELGWAAP